MEEKNQWINEPQMEHGPAREQTGLGCLGSIIPAETGFDQQTLKCLLVWYGMK